MLVGMNGGRSCSPMIPPVKAGQNTGMEFLQAQ